MLREAMVLKGRGWLGAEDLALPARARDPGPVAAPPAAIPAADARRQRALELAASPAGVSTSRFARATGIGLTLAREELGTLAAAGALRRTGTGRAVRYVPP